MKVRRALSFLILAFVAINGAAYAQDAGSPQQPNPASRGNGQRGGRGAWGGMMGRGTMGTVTEVAPDHFTIKTESGDLYTIHYSANTRIMKGGGQRRGQDNNEPPANPPQSIKATDIKVGDAIAAMGEADATAKSIGAVAIFQIDPERARQMREMQANYGKTWFMGKVTAVNDVKVTLQGGPDNATRTFEADENTTFRKRREPITLADIHPGDMVRVEGALKNGAFLATTVADMGAPGDRGNASPPPPQ